MSVASFIGFRPIPRYDQTPWTDVRFEEAAGREGPYAPIETVALAPVDADPTHPAARNLTTTQATITDGWYRLVFLDAALNEWAGAPVAASGAEEVSAQTVRDASALLRVLYPPEPFDAEVEAELSRVVGEAIALVDSITCGAVTAGIRDPRLILRAVTIKAEEVAIAADVERARTAATRAGGGGLRSISAGSWSESYFDPGAAAKASQVSANPILNETLWALMDEACRAAFLSSTGVVVPATAVTRMQPRRRGPRY